MLMDIKKDIKQLKNLKNYFKMEQTMSQQAMQQEAMQLQSQRIQLDLSIMQIKMNLLTIANEINKTNTENSILDTYYVLRQEVLGIPVPEVEVKEEE